MNWIPIATALSLAGTAPLIAGPSPQTAKPNVLFVYADDLNTEGVHDLAPSITPNLDRLRKESVSFSNALCAVPLCGPSRACILTGLRASTTGWYGFGQNPEIGKGWKDWSERPVIKDAVKLPQHFAQNGYQVYGTGKIAHAYHKDAWLFDNVDGKNRYAFSPVTQGPTPKGGKKPSFTPEPIRTVGRWFAPLSQVPEGGWWVFNTPFRYVNEEDRDLMSDEKSANFAVDVLKESHDKPFFLAVGFCKPHEPLVAPQKYFDLMKKVDFKMPPYLPNDLADCAKILHGNTLNERVFKAIQESGEGYYKEYVRAYLACVAFMDDQLGKVLDALQKSPYADNTIIVFCGDNGFHLGEKDMCEKTTPWAESTRIPLVIHVPGMKDGGDVCKHPVSLVDLYPTLIDYCRLPKNPNEKGSGIPLDGFSLRPFLENPLQSKWDGPDVAVSAVMGRPTAEQKQDCMVPAKKEDQHFTACADRYLYILCSDGEEELYDHEADPHEWTNLASNPEYNSIKANLKTSLLKQTGR